ncbi:hypothetical protein PsYK624_009510 [Phanerochaete sordida]|uniref:Decapping nuclease n=1 Tax=Phanerochaete sordida TaxID=48140 RepID=A0A9P3FYW6_9APHY|nr:hypothetical protein PsYK624_009510 [Phanerochaete sordida]
MITSIGRPAAVLPVYLRSAVRAARWDSITPPRVLRPQPPEFTPVEHIAHFSWDAPFSTIRYDLSNLGKFGEPTPNAQLLTGRRTFLQRNYDNNVAGHPRPLSYIVKACRAMGTLDHVKAADVVTWRGILKNIMVGRSLQLRFSFKHRALYLDEVDKHGDRVLRGQLRDGYHGYSFENLCDEEPEEIPSLVEWCCVCSRMLGGLRLVFGAEVDCVHGEYDGTSRNLVELKTRPQRNRRSGGQRRLWFVQSYLAGVPKLYVGFRSTSFTLTRGAWVSLADLLPPPETMNMMHRRLHNVLTELRIFCEIRAQVSASAPRELWTATVKNGVLTPPAFDGYASPTKRSPRLREEAQLMFPHSDTVMQTRQRT